MLSWIIQITIISFILIFLVHHLISFFTTTLTVPKIKDLVHSSSQKYENMYNIIKNNRNHPDHMDSLDLTNDYADLLPKKEEISMKSELKNFLKKQLQSSSSDGTSISELDSMSGIQSFSNF